MKFFKILFFSFLLVLLTGCNDEKEIDIDYEYVNNMYIESNNTFFPIDSSVADYQLETSMNFYETRDDNLFTFKGEIFNYGDDQLIVTDIQVSDIGLDINNYQINDFNFTETSSKDIEQFILEPNESISIIIDYNDDNTYILSSETSPSLKFNFTNENNPYYIDDSEQTSPITFETKTEEYEKHNPINTDYKVVPNTIYTEEIYSHDIAAYENQLYTSSDFFQDVVNGSSNVPNIEQTEDDFMESTDKVLDVSVNITGDNNSQLLYPGASYISEITFINNVENSDEEVRDGLKNYIGPFVVFVNDIQADNFISSSNDISCSRNFNNYYDCEPFNLDEGEQVTLTFSGYFPSYEEEAASMISVDDYFTRTNINYSLMYQREMVDIETDEHSMPKVVEAYGNVVKYTPLDYIFLNQNYDSTYTYDETLDITCTTDIQSMADSMHTGVITPNVSIEQCPKNEDYWYLARNISILHTLTNLKEEQTYDFGQGRIGLTNTNIIAALFLATENNLIMQDFKLDSSNLVQSSYDNKKFIRFVETDFTPDNFYDKIDYNSGPRWPIQDIKVMEYLETIDGNESIKQVTIVVTSDLYSFYNSEYISGYESEDFIQPKFQQLY